MSGYVFVMGECLVCGKVFTFNPHAVPSTNNEPICESCITHINRVRQDQGLEPFPVLADAYEAIPEGEL